MKSTIIKASAGSGKTFQLSNQFLDIVLRAEGKTSETIHSILASTFTRKAAGEILDRILNRLAEAALDKKKQNELAEFVPLPAKNRTELLQKTTAEIAKNLYRLRICTLDSFFNHIASSFALELGLPPGWSIISEPEYQCCIHEAVREVFAESKKNEVLKMLHLLQKGEQDRNVTQEITGLAKDYLPLVRSTDADLWDHSGSDRLGSLVLGKMTDEMITASIAPLINDEEYLRQIVPKGKTGKPNGHCVNDIKRLLLKIQNQNWEELLTLKVARNFAAGNFIIRDDVPPADDALLEHILPAVRHARAIWAETIIHQTKATRSLLDLVWEKLEAVLQHKRGFQFTDITFCLGDLFLRKPNALPQKLLSHRMDAPTEHLLLDEFQDTSLPQWSILRPFIQSVTQGTKTSFFCVGDLKQAIYGWRGGVAEIFETVENFLEKEGTAEPETPDMNETWRNSQAVIDTVNQVFLNIGTNTAICEKSPLAAAKWQKWFGNDKHETKSPSKDKGYCVLEITPAEETGESNEDDESMNTEKPFWKYTLNRITQLKQQHPNRSIGVLFRYGKNIPTLLKGLKKRGIEASDEGGVPLTDSAAVQHVLSVMTLIDHPGDTIVRFHLTNGPLAEMLPLQDYKDDAAAEKAAHHWRTKILTRGYGKTVKELMAALTPCEPKEMQRLEKLLELAYRFDDQATGTRTRPFIEAVQTARLATPGADSIRVMTIHGAKGLEFDIVVLPDLDVELVSSRKIPKVIVSQDLPTRDSPTPSVNFVLRWVDQKLRTLLPSPYPEAFVQWQDNQVKESLAVLYVAMTRARYELVMIVPEKSKHSTGTYFSVLYAGLLDGRPQTTDGNILYQNGTENWDDEVVPEKPKLPTLTWHALSDQLRLRNLPRETPSGQEVKRVIQGKESGMKRNATPEWNRNNASLRGTAIHACFSTVRWMEEGMLGVESLQRIAKQSVAGKRGDINFSEIVDEFFSMCNQSEVRKILLRSSYPTEEDISVETERRFAVRVQNKILHGSIDRLVIRRLGSEVVGLEIIDFKTDRPGSESDEDFLAERKRIYVPQMEAYRRAIQAMYPNVGSISAAIVFVSMNEVVILESSGNDCWNETGNVHNGLPR